MVCMFISCYVEPFCEMFCSFLFRALVEMLLAISTSWFIADDKKLNKNISYVEVDADLISYFNLKLFTLQHLIMEWGVRICRWKLIWVKRRRIFSVKSSPTPILGCIFTSNTWSANVERTYENIDLCYRWNVFLLKIWLTLIIVSISWFMITWHDV